MKSVQCYPPQFLNGFEHISKVVPPRGYAIAVEHCDWMKSTHNKLVFVMSGIIQKWAVPEKIHTLLHREEISAIQKGGGEKNLFLIVY